MTTQTCGAVADGTPPDWACQLGAGHHTPDHIYADAVTTFRWANGGEGYVPEDCPDPSVHDEDED